MKTLSISSRLATLALFAALAGSAVYAQGYYDDDIYYDASKDTKQPKESVNKNAADRSRLQNQREAQYYYDGAQYVPWNNVGNLGAIRGDVEHQEPCPFPRFATGAGSLCRKCG